MSESKWTTFMDMHSGGGRKYDFGYAAIEADEDTAVAVFKNRYRDPDHVTCTCCGSDFSVWEHDSLKDMLDYLGVDEKELSDRDYCVIRANEITDQDRSAI